MIPSPLERTRARFRRQIVLRIELAVKPTVRPTRGLHDVPRINHGIFFCISGGTKLLVPAQFTLMEQTLAQSHIPFPHFNAYFVSLVEFACGGALALGLLTPVCALVLAVDMIVAIMTNRIHSIQVRGVLAWLDDFLYLLEVLYVMILVWLIFSGPGRYSIDGLIAQRTGASGMEPGPRAVA